MPCTLFIGYHLALDGESLCNISFTTLIISKKPRNTGDSWEIGTEFTTHLLHSEGALTRCPFPWSPLFQTAHIEKLHTTPQTAAFSFPFVEVRTPLFCAQMEKEGESLCILFPATTGPLNISFRRIASHSIVHGEKVNAVAVSRSINTRLSLQPREKAPIFQGLLPLLFLWMLPFGKQLYL